MLSRFRSLFSPPKKRDTGEAEQRLKNEGFDLLFKEDNTSAIKADYADLLTLVDIVRDVRPNFVLEYGTGWSTYILATTMARMNPQSRLSVVELDPKWIEVSRSRIPDDAMRIVRFEDVKPQLTIVNAPADIATNRWYGGKPGKKPERVGIATITFPALHSQSPDLIFLDGPAPDQVPGYQGIRADSSFSEISTIVSDPIFMKGNFTICVDGRHAQCAFLKNNLEPDYSVEIREKQKFSIFRPSVSS